MEKITCKKRTMYKKITPLEIASGVKAVDIALIKPANRNGYLSLYLNSLEKYLYLAPYLL